LIKANSLKKVVLKPKKAEAVRRRHPWVFSGAIRHLEEGIRDGDPVEVIDSQHQTLGTGHYQEGSIRVRLFSFERSEPDTAFWTEKLRCAQQVRKALGFGDPDRSTNAYRLVQAEGDQLPGLIIDIYHDTAVIQCHSIGMHRHRFQLAAALQAIFGEQLRAIYDKSKETLPAYYAQEIQNNYLLGERGTPSLRENGLTFRIDWEGGQKTGFFLDQRDNRQLVEQYASGRRMLNAFAYTGGFSLFGLRGGAALVHSVDASQQACDQCHENVRLNQLAEPRHQVFTKDVLKFLRESTTVYDLMVVDPPAYAKSLKKRHNAVQGYKRLNALALKKIASGGLLFTFSCSQVVDRALFYHTLVAAALEAGRQVRLLRHLGQPADHPVNLFHPEGGYLKGLMLYVE